MMQKTISPMIGFLRGLSLLAAIIFIPSLSNSQDVEVDIEDVEDLIGKEKAPPIENEVIPSDHPYGSTPLERMVALAHTTNLPNCDQVEVFALRYRDPSKRRSEVVRNEGSPKFLGAEILATKKLDQVRSKSLCSKWRELEFDKWQSAFCHYPAYGLRFSNEGQVLYETSICWKCSNVLVPDVSLDEDDFDFEDDDATTKAKWRPTIQTYGFKLGVTSDALLKALTQISPHPQMNAIAAGAERSSQ